MAEKDKYTKVCVSCHQEFAARRSNAKRCSICRLSRDIEFMRDRLYKCWICDHQYAPLDMKDNTCGECQYEPKRYGVTECVRCHVERPRVAEGLPLCFECAKNPEWRVWFVRELRAKIDQRRERAAL